MKPFVCASAVALCFAALAASPIAFGKSLSLDFLCRTVHDLECRSEDGLVFGLQGLEVTSAARPNVLRKWRADDPRAASDYVEGIVPASEGNERHYLSGHDGGRSAELEYHWMTGLGAVRFKGGVHDVRCERKPRRVCIKM